jgi:tRNA (guanine37-N1)-methyltransferase
MRLDVITIFPEFFQSPLETGLLGKAIASGALEIAVHDLRSWADNSNRKVDDEAFGGGAGMVMAPGPVVEAVRSINQGGATVIVLTPSGKRFDQPMAERLVAEDQLILICGRYEGIDHRVVEVLGAEEISIGDFVLTGGEAAALAIIEAISRLMPGYLGNEESLDEESFSAGLLEYPQYTRPAKFEGVAVPEVLRSGNHAEIRRWRRRESLRRTWETRPDLLEGADLTDEERNEIRRWNSDS